MDPRKNSGELRTRLCSYMPTMTLAPEQPSSPATQSGHHPKGRARIRHPRSRSGQELPGPAGQHHPRRTRRGPGRPQRRDLRLPRPQRSREVHHHRMLCALARPTAGHATVAGTDVLAHPDQVRGKIGTALPNSALDPDLTVDQNLYIHARLYGLRRRHARRAHRDTGKGGPRPTGGASRFARSRAACAADWNRPGHAARPRVLFLDEPTTGLDPHARAQVWELLARSAGTARKHALHHHPLSGGGGELRPPRHHRPRPARWHKARASLSRPRSATIWWRCTPARTPQPNTSSPDRAVEPRHHRGQPTG